jgi:hypothetical protein
MGEINTCERSKFTGECKDIKHCVFIGTNYDTGSEIAQRKIASLSSRCNTMIQHFNQDYYQVQHRIIGITELRFARLLSMFMAGIILFCTCLDVCQQSRK